MEDFRKNDPALYRNFTRIEPALFDEIHDRVKNRLMKMTTNCREPLEVGLKLAATLRYLATGNSYVDISYGFSCSNNTMSLFVPEVLMAILEEYTDECIEAPNTVAQWERIAGEFQSKWNLPHCLGALDGKHCKIKKPEKSGSDFYNYKGFFSIVLLALVDANYKFIWVDTGGNGCNSDAQLFNDSELKEYIMNKKINFPPDQPLPNDDKPFPFFIVGDDAFALNTWLMKPYGRNKGLTYMERIFNYRLSRGRRIVENAFGIMSLRWQVILKGMNHSDVETSRLVVDACVVLHNLLRMRYPNSHQNLVDHFDHHGNVIPGAWRDVAPMNEVEQVRGPSREKTVAKRRREYLKLFFSSDAGKVPWQDRMI